MIPSQWTLTDAWSALGVWKICYHLFIDALMSVWVLYFIQLVTIIGKNILSYVKHSNMQTVHSSHSSIHPSMHPTRPNQVISNRDPSPPPTGICLLNNIRELALTRWQRAISARGCTIITIAFGLWLSLRLKWPGMRLLNKWVIIKETAREMNKHEQDMCISLFFQSLGSKIACLVWYHHWFVNHRSVCVGYVTYKPPWSVSRFVTWVMV